jgi:hypothetical protein
VPDVKALIKSIETAAFSAEPVMALNVASKSSKVLEVFTISLPTYPKPTAPITLPMPLKLLLTFFVCVSVFLSF